MLNSESTNTLLNEYEEELTGCGGSLPCNPKRRLHRYLVLILICFLSFGSYYCYDNPAALEEHFLKDLSLNAFQYMLIYALYSWPNVVLSFVGGFLIDKLFGIRLGSVIFSIFVVCGQLVFAAGAYTQYFAICLVGRFIFGIGGESLAVGQNTYASAWFDNTELNFVFGLQLSMSRIGSTVNLNTMGLIYNSMPNNKHRLGLALFIAATTCVFSLICALVLGYFDRRAERILSVQRKKSSEDEEKIHLKDILHFSPAFWLICGICIAYYVAVFPFISLAKVFFIQKFNETPNSAALYTSLVFIISAVVSPVSGFLIDLTGRNIFWVGSGTLITLGCYALMAFTWLTPPVVTVLLGIAYSVLASSLWPMIVFVVPLHQRGTAFGLMQSVQNLGLGLIGLLAGLVQDRFGFLVLLVFFALCLCIALLLTVLLYFWDAHKDGVLNESGWKRRAKISKEEFLVSQTVDT